MKRKLCTNYDLCENTWSEEEEHPISDEFCMTCGSWFKFGFGWDALEFKNTDEECCICQSISGKQVKFPTNCGHWFCISCSRNILFYDETKYHLSPVLYGCPPCPNNCMNPTRGQQCYCENYDVIIELWKQENKVQYDKWNHDENISIENGVDISGNCFGNQTCPLCRKKYIRENFNNYGNLYL